MICKGLKTLKNALCKKQQQMLLTTISSICCIISAPETAHAQLSYHLGGRLFIDGGTYIHAPEGFNAGTSISDIRLTGKFGWGDQWKGKIDVGYAGNKVSLKDAYLQHNRGDHMFRVGHMYSIFSLDQSSSSNDLLFLTPANVAEVFSPGRRIGVSYTYSTPSLYASAGMFCGDRLNFKKEVKQGANGTVRFVYRPWHEEGRLLHIGTGTLLKVPDRPSAEEGRLLELEGSGNTSLSSPGVFNVRLENVKQQWQWNLESILQYGRFFMQAEYMRMWVNRIAMPAYSAHGGYVECGWVIRGRTLVYDAQDALQVCAPGEHSVLLFGRFNCTDMNDGSLTGGKMYDASIGANYYPYKYLIFRLNYSHQWTDEYTVTGKQNWGLLQARVQLKF